MLLILLKRQPIEQLAVRAVRVERVAKSGWDCGIAEHGAIRRLIQLLYKPDSAIILSVFHKETHKKKGVLL